MVIIQSNWAEISHTFRQKKQYRCERCTVSLIEPGHRRLLHTHHINGVKSDNNESNLCALCVDCHSKQDFHQQMFVPYKDKQIIIQLRIKQNIINSENNWQELFDYADSAVHGVLHLCQSTGIKPSIGLMLPFNNGEHIELGWPSARIGVVISNSTARFDGCGWLILRTDEFIQNFEQIRGMLR